VVEPFERCHALFLPLSSGLVDRGFDSALARSADAERSSPPLQASVLGKTDIPTEKIQRIEFKDSRDLVLLSKRAYAG
jgi:hypothetical protein